MPLCQKAALDLFVVLDNAVVNEPDVALAVGMRVGVQFRDSAVRRPARVDYAKRAFHRLWRDPARSGGRLRAPADGRCREAMLPFGSKNSESILWWDILNLVRTHFGGNS